MTYNSICISSGHGKYVAGASGSPVPPQLVEVTEARRVTDRVFTMLKERGVDVRKWHDDQSKSQSENLSRIVDWHNAQGPHDLDVSVHFNAYNHSAHGTEVLYVSQKTLAVELSKAISAAGHFTDRGGKLNSGLAFLNGTHAPAVLLEICFCDNTSDSNLYNQHFEDICEAIADTLGGAGEDVEEGGEGEETLPPDGEYLFEATGKCSHFGGPLDTGVSASEGLAFFYDLNADNQHLFLPLVPAGTTGLARRLNAEAVHYLAVRWDYDVTPKTMLASSGDMALVTNVSTGASATAYPADWGPHGDTNRVADLSPALMRDLGLETDDVVEVVYPLEGRLTMIASIITLLIYACILAIVVYLVIWVLGIIGVPMPPKVIQLLWVIVALIIILMLVNMVLGGGNSFRLPGLK